MFKISDCNYKCVGDEITFLAYNGPKLTFNKGNLWIGKRPNLDIDSQVASTFGLELYHGVCLVVASARGYLRETGIYNPFNQ